MPALNELDINKPRQEKFFQFVPLYLENTLGFIDSNIDSHIFSQGKLREFQIKLKNIY